MGFIIQVFLLQLLNKAILQKAQGQNEVWNVIVEVHTLHVDGSDNTNTFAHMATFPDPFYKM